MAWVPETAWKEQLQQYSVVGIGGLLCAVAINAFLVPHHLLSGGLAGVGIILHFLFNWPIGFVLAMLNIPLLGSAYSLMDRPYTVGSLYGMAIFSLALDGTGFLLDLNLVDDTMLASIYGGVIYGVGSGIVFRVDGSLGGTDIVAAIMKKYYAFNMSYVGFAINCVIMTVAAFLFGFKPAMFTLLSMYVGAVATDRVIQGFNTKKTIMIISEENAQIAAAINNEIGRGVTFLRGQGSFTQEDRKVLFVVVTLVQIAKIKPLVNRIDPAAFMIVQDAVEVLGKGFTIPGTKS